MERERERKLGIRMDDGLNIIIIIIIIIIIKGHDWMNGDIIRNHQNFLRKKDILPFEQLMERYIWKHLRFHIVRIL